jgi:ribonuclease G
VLQKWFRKKPRTAEEAPSEAAPAAPRTQDTGSTPETDPARLGPDGRPKRRRGNRGGRGRKKPGESTATAEKTEKPDRPDRPERGRGDQDAKPKRRRTQTRRTSSTGSRAALADVKKEIFISVEVGEQCVAVVEDGSPSEVYLERPGRRSIAGNIYKGTVDNVLPGMEASFVDIGLGRNGFLYVDEIVVPELEGKRHGRRIQELVQRGQEVLVQAVKDPMGTKGARLTTEISLPGRFLVYTPFGEGIGISRRLEDNERERLKGISKQLEIPEGGIIIRTAAEGASKEELEGDLALLQKLWSTLKSRAARTSAPALVYQEAELPLRIVRDLFIRDFERVVIDHEQTYRRIVGYLKRTSDDLADRVELYDGKERLLAKYGVDEAVKSTLKPRVDLPSGGYLIFDYAEAFTVVDVNTGRFVGARGKSSGARLEDTITKNNLEAVSEVVRQLRLRDIGGIIVIDFIDMANPKNRALVEEALKNELEKDRTKTYVVEISPLGLVEMTRQNVTDGPREILTHACPVCEGHGIVVSDETYAVEAERKLRSLVLESRHQAFKIELSSNVAGILIGPGASRLEELERETGRRFFFETKDDLPSDHFAVLDRGPVSRLEPKSLPVSKGQELELKLEEAHLHSEGDAIARLNGYVIAVAGAKSQVGKTVKVRIERATRTVAYAVLASAGAAVEAPVEAGSELDREDAGVAMTPKRSRGSRGGRGRKPEESEAKSEEQAEAKPSRPPRTRGSRGGQGRKPQVAEAATDGQPEAKTEPSRPPRNRGQGGRPPQQTFEATTDEAPVEVDGRPETTGETPEKPKKKTRRGSRGGRNRKKKTPVGEATNGAAAMTDPPAEPVVVEAEGAETPDAPTNGADPEAKPKKRTRRGSRGGRNRRKKPAVTPEAETTDEPPLAPVAVEEEPG